jgi:hypothetical protein
VGISSLAIAQPSTRHKNYSPRSQEAETSGECVINEEKMDTLSTLALAPQRAVALIVTSQTYPPNWSDRCRLWKPPRRKSQERFLLQEQGLEASKDKKLQGMMWRTRTKAAFAMHVTKRVTWAKTAQRVTFLNPTLPIMISISLWMIRMGLVLWGRLVLLKLEWEPFGFLRILWLIL